MRFLSPCAVGIFAVSCTVSLWGCSSSSTPSAKGPTIVGTGATTSQAVTSAGGTVTLQGSSITIPPGAVAASQTITIQSTTNAPPAGVTNVSPIYQFGPAGLVFSKPVTIQLDFTSNGSTPAFAWTNPNSSVFGILPSTVSGTTVTAQVTHFSQGFVADGTTVAALPAGSDDAGSPTTGEDGGAPDDATLPGADASPPCTVCSNGFCESACPAGSITCGTSTTCVITDTDPLNCGACGNACASGEACVAGTCVPSCYSSPILSGCTTGVSEGDGGIDCSSCGIGYSQCGSECTQTSTDSSNCGGCGIGCAPGQTCSAGACVPVCPGTDVCSARACVSACPTGQAVCGVVATGATGFCTSPQSDPLNCGACGTACASGQLCVAGACVGSCAGPFTSGSGVATPLSDGGIACTPPYSACDQECTDLSSDPLNCGACGTLCTSGQVCSSGVCGPICTGTEVCTAAGACETACPSGQTVCNVLASGATSTCDDLGSDPANCGACGHSCAANEACLSGVCTVTCN